MIAQGGITIPKGVTEADAALEQARVQVRFYRLTPRWTELKPHPMQQLFVWHPSRFKINPSGRRSGKTENLKRKAVIQLVKKRKWPARLFLAAPTFGQARDIFWEDMKALIPAAWVRSISETRLEIITKWGAMLRVFGFDRPRRIEGVPWDWGGVDEIADCPARCFALNVRPALSTIGRYGGCDLIGVPDEVGRNQAEYEELYDIGLQWHPNAELAKDADICSFHWRSADILEAGEIAKLKATLDTHAFEQEMNGRFVSSGGKALPRFDVRAHVREEYCGYARSLPLDWTLDFGVTPAASLLCQSYNGRVWVIDEMVIDDGSTEAQVERFRETWLAEYNPHAIRLFGDAAGNQRHSPIGTTDYDTLELWMKDLNVQWEQLDAAPLVKDSLNSVRCKVATADQHVHLHVHPRCQKLIKEMRTAPWPDKDQLRKFHCLAALRYYCWRLFGEGMNNYATSSYKLPNLGGRGHRN